MGHRIASVAEGSVAARHGIRAGDELLNINGEPVLDQIDYQALSARARLRLSLAREGGAYETLLILKSEDEPLGLTFDKSMTLVPRSCHNRCVFCFIDQMPKGLRQSLYVKDDDWRFSLMMGNFVTLTNLDEKEFSRVIRRHASPLYISVHATEPALRARMMNNRFAGDVMERLQRLKDADIRFHCQIVVCPGWNDGEALWRTLDDLVSLAPAALSAALVPVGLTRFRDRLTPLTPFDRDSARALLDGIEPFQRRCLQTLGSTFVFPSDEFFCLAQRPIPPDSWYEGYPQIENGVGLLRLLETEMEEAREDDDGDAVAVAQTLVAPVGVSAAPHIERMMRRFAPEGTTVRVVPIRNRFFGESVTVTGLLTGGDLLEQLTPRTLDGADRLLLNACMLRSEGDLFLDDMTLCEFRRRMPVPVDIVRGGGQALYDALRGRAAGG